MPAWQDGLDKAADQVMAAITDNTKFVLLSRPNNPMGFVMPQEQIRRMLETGKVIIVDEAYIEMADDRHFGFSMGQRI